MSQGPPKFRSVHGSRLTGDSKEEGGRSGSHSMQGMGKELRVRSLLPAPPTADTSCPCLSCTQGLMLLERKQ